MQLLQGDCLELMKDIPDGSIDMILCDLPYGTTHNKWDSVIDLDRMWSQYKRIIKPNGCIALFAQTPFDKVLGVSNLSMLKYEWIWEKTMATGFLNSHFAPMKCHENVLIFSKAAATFVRDRSHAMAYNPQMTAGDPYKVINNTKSTNYNINKIVTTDNPGYRYPRDVIRLPHDKRGLHPTQKPVPLLEYLIKTYTDPGQVVLDNCMGSGSTGVACVNTGRDFIGIELDPGYFETAKNRIEKQIAEKVSA